MNANNGKFKLRDLLAVPMQRVLKYHLLLKVTLPTLIPLMTSREQELIKCTDKDHVERRQLETALEAMQDLSLYVNEVKRDDEALQLLKAIQDRCVSP